VQLIWHGACLLRRDLGVEIPVLGPKPRQLLAELTLVGSLYLAGVCLLPEFLLTGFKVGRMPWLGPALAGFFPEWFTEGMGINFYFGGTSLLIVVGVAMDTIQQIESQLVMRDYEGFMKKGRIRGRRG